MIYLIETIDGRLIEVTNILDKFGNEVSDHNLAEACVIKDGNEIWRALDVKQGIIHRVQ